MSLPDDALSELRVVDLLILLAVKRTGSVTGAARELNVATSQVSKAVTRLEGLFRTQLLSRGPRGVSLSEAGARVLPHVEEIIARLRFVQRNESLPGLEEVTVAAPSYLSHLLVPFIVVCQPQARVRSFELSAPAIRARLGDQLFDMALVLGRPSLPETWSETRVGDIRHGLFGPPEVAEALGDGPVSVERVLDLPFVMPVTSVDGRAVVGDDGCPVSPDRRKSGHQVQTIALGLDVAARSGQVAYGPVIAATDFIARGRLREIFVEGWDVREALYVICNGNRVRSRQNAAITLALRDALKELDARFEDRASMRVPVAPPEP